MKKTLFLLGYFLKRPKVVKSYYEIQRNKECNIDYLNKIQNEKLKEIIEYAVREVPYYSELFNSLGLTPEDVQTTQDLKKLPILTKEIIKNDPEKFIARNYKGRIVGGTTGGSTGVPLKYKMSDNDYSRGVALLFRGFGMAGYELGDKMAIIAGSSLTSNKQGLKSRMQDWIMNINHFSSYGMTNEEFHKFYLSLNKKQPKFLRGYASSLFLLANYMNSEGLKLDYQIKSIFSTAEKLLSHQRKIIEKVFDTKVFDNYGLNDGGVSAYECHLHNGFHIDYERSVLEITDSDGSNQLVDQQGKILATTLYNYAMPFIRYDTGDLGEISSEPCICGCPRALLKEVAGRTTDYLKINGTYVGSPVLTILMGKVDVDFYQIIQTDSNYITINIVKGKSYTNNDENFIINSITKHVNNVNIKFNYLANSEIDFNSNKKHKFIINDKFR